ncbi:MAG: hypothetical protein ACFB21_08805 [Opitutales bacterium]
MMENRALVFLKPKAATPAFTNYVTHVLRDRGVRLTGPLEVSMEQMRDGALVDAHYFSISRAALTADPASLPVSEVALASFAETFGESWESAAAKGRLLSAVQMMEKTGIGDGAAFLQRWLGAPQKRLAPGLYVAKFKQPEALVLNGFYPALRQRYLTTGAKVICFDVAFDADKLSWERFRRDVIGDTRPEEANPGTLRRCLLERYADLGCTPPNVNQNGVHASAGPIEALRERWIWLGEAPAQTPLGQALLRNGLSANGLDHWLENTVVNLAGTTGPVFDITEDMDAPEVLRALRPKAAVV